MRCPVCRADNAEGPQCRRCKADLGLLFTLDEQRAHALAAARRCAPEGQLSHALHFAERADALRSDDQSRQLLAVLHLLRRDFARAWHCARLRRTAASR